MLRFHELYKIMCFGEKGREGRWEKIRGAHRKKIKELRLTLSRLMAKAMA